MNVLFLTIGGFEGINQHSVYTDLLRQFQKNGHEVYVVCSREKRFNLPMELIDDGGAHVLKVQIGNITKTNIIEKGISTILIGQLYKKAIRNYFASVKFNLILYSTPPITFAKVVEFIKRRDNAKTYLMLKDIFPQNAVDIGMMSKTGVKGLLYRYFRRKEKKLYAISDRIGCMSQANVDYLLQNNPEVSKGKVEICSNCIEVQDMTLSFEEHIAMRQKYGIPTDKKVFLYGGNLGRPQDIPFIIECLKSQEQNQGAFFLIVGDGTEFGKLESYFNEAKPRNMKLMQQLPKDDYEKMIHACDVGLLFLDHRFTIPNFPSRLLSYMQASLPVLACTDPNTDVGKVIVEGGFGWWCESNNVQKFTENVDKAVVSDLFLLGEQAKRYLKTNYSVKCAYDAIAKTYNS